RHGEEGCFRILTGEPLPPGWTGKGWACHQLARAATAAQGEYLLFLDADTEQTPEMLASAIALARESGADLLSAWPYLKAGSWSEKLVLPMIHLSLVFYPHALWQRLQRTPSRIAALPRSIRRGFGAANGQFLLFRREAYEKIGGHAAQKGHLVEDVALGRAIANRAGEGMRLINCDGTPIANVRMYTCFAEVWEGFTKNIRAAFEGSVGLYIGTGVMMTAVFFLPFVWIWLLEGAAFRLVAAQIGLIYLIRTVLMFRFRTPWLGTLLHPVGQFLCTTIALNSWRKSVGPGVTWKGRLYEVIHPE
ncbi:MAG TPA: glycosyltransferase, partial [Chthoniobacteraceae bacterium]|nr:glycosyltransferase [Chthoniobacteraceae bacterium]